MIVYPLWHVGHQNEAGDDGSTVHVDESGVFCDEAVGARHSLARAAGAIGEQEEYERCTQFLKDSSPAAAQTLG